MVRESRYDGRPLYTCEECGLGYDDRAMAEECEGYCSTHQSCSLKITRHAVRTPDLPQ